MTAECQRMPTLLTLAADGYHATMPITSKHGAIAMAPMTHAARRQVLGMNIAYVKISRSQKT